MDIINSQNKNSQNAGGPRGESPDLGGGEEKEKAVRVSNEIKLEDEINGSTEDDIASKEFFKKRRKIFKAGIIGVLLLFLAAAVWGFGYYEKYAKKVALEDVLPADAAVVARLNINPDSGQFKFLDANFEKFPGHFVVMKSMDEVGEGIKPSEFFQKKLKEMGIDFSEDINPALGEEAYVLVPSLEPLEREFRQRISSAKIRYGEKVKDYLALSEASLQKKFAQQRGEDGTRVMGAFNDYYYLAEEGQNGEFVPLDLILGSEIEDMGKAREVLKKIEGDKQRYQTSKLEHAGHAYYKIADKEKQKKETAVLNLDSTFHALIGSNWVMSSCEEQMKKIISISRAGNFSGRIISKIPFKKADNEVFRPLSADAQYASFVEETGGDFAENELAQIFFRLDAKKIFESEEFSFEQGGEFPGYFKYPEQLAASFSFSAQEDGLKFKMNSNRYTLGQKADKPFMEGLVEKIPNRLDGRWADAYFEYGNPKDVYYSFKRNNLSSEGLEFWDKTRIAIRDSVGVDVEKDVVDQIAGDIAVVGYTGRGLEPEGVVVVGVESEERIVATAKRLLELGKQIYLSASPYGACFARPAGETEGKLRDQALQESDAFCASLDGNPAQRDFVEKHFESVLASEIRETKNEFGTIYSYNLPGTELSFDFSFKDKQAIFGTHYAAVEAMLKQLGADPQNSIIANKYYKQVASNVFSQGYTKVCLNSFGIWNSVEYYLKESKLGMSEEDSANLSAVGSIVKTIKLLGSSDAVSAKSGGIMSSLYLNIQELPAEEKAKAEQIISAW